MKEGKAYPKGNGGSGQTTKAKGLDPKTTKASRSGKTGISKMYKK